MIRKVSLTFVYCIATFILGVPVVAAIQPDRCPALVRQALSIAGNACADLGRNQVCYGHNQAEALDSDANTLTGFTTVGDITTITRISTLRTAAFNSDENIWGVALLSLQANVPDTLPGQAVTFVVYGDAEIIATTSDDPTYAAPMQAFMLSTGIGQPACKEAPHDGVLVQSPEGLKVNFLVNGIAIEIGSTVLLDVRGENKLWVSTLAGEARVTSAGETQTARPGFKVVTVPGEPPAEPEPYANSDVQGVPVDLLPAAVTVPFILDSVAATADWVEAGFSVEAGRSYRIVTGGQVNIWPDCTPALARDLPFTCEAMRFGPGGSDGLVLASTDYPLPGERIGAVIARIGESGAPFLVGEGVTFTASASGRLHLRMNDPFHAEDNVGAFVVIATPER